MAAACWHASPSPAEAQRALAAMLGLPIDSTSAIPWCSRVPVDSAARGPHGLAITVTEMNVAGDAARGRHMDGRAILHAHHLRGRPRLAPVTLAYIHAVTSVLVSNDIARIIVPADRRP